VRNAAAPVVTFVVIVLVAQLSGQPGSRNDASNSVVGMWKLVSIVQDGGQAPNRGANPTGLIVYDTSGLMSVQIMPDRVRPKYAATDPTPEEAKEALRGYTAYFGRYTVDTRAKTVTHHRHGSVNPGDIGGDLVRRFEFAPGDRIILTPLENPTRRLTWERVK
jgi:catechol 1,2-dioxygenase